MSNPIAVWLYSIDNLDPELATTKVKLDDAPWSEGVDTFGEAWGRGSVHTTLGGVVVQDFGVKDVDRTIRFSGVEALSATTISALEAMYKLQNMAYYFKDGCNGTFMVQFSRKPPGLRYWKSMKYARYSKAYYSYEITLLVRSKVA